MIFTIHIQSSAFHPIFFHLLRFERSFVCKIKYIMRHNYCLFLWIAFLSTVTSFSQVLDQSNTANAFGTAETVTLGQSFTAGLSGRLAQFDFQFYNAGAYNYKCELKIYSGTGITGTLLKTQPFIIGQNVGTGAFPITINDGPTVVVGEIYSAVITVVNGGTTGGKIRYAYSTNYPNQNDGTSTDSYPYGERLFSTGTYSEELFFKTYVSEVPATHLNFDGTNDYITLSNEASFDFTNQMTVEFWMNSNTSPDYWDGLVTKGDDSWRVALTPSGTIDFALGGTSFGSVTSTVSVIDGNWHHVAFTYNGTNAIIYIDGVQNASQSGTGSLNNSAYNVAIGENLQAAGRYYTGSMDEVRIWNIARSASEISSAKNCELSGTESGLVAYYNFNQGMGYRDNTSITSLIDDSSNGNNGIFNGFALNGTTSNFITSDGIKTPVIPTLYANVIFSSMNPIKEVYALTGTLLWYTTATGGIGATTPPALDFSGNGSASYWISAINSRGCESDRAELLVVNAAAIPDTPTALPVQVYKGEGTLANLTATGTNLEWFSTKTGGTALPLSTVLVDNTPYYVSQAPQGVRSARIPVIAKKISASSQLFCNNFTVADLIATPTSDATAKWFANSTDSTPLANSDALTSGTLYVQQNSPLAITPFASGFSNPEGIAVDASGSIYLADTQNNAIKKISADGTTIQTIGTGFYRPKEVAVDMLGNIYVVDTHLKNIVKMNSQGGNKKLIYDFGGGPIDSYEYRIYPDRLGNIYLHYNYSITKMDSEGGNVQSILSSINGKSAMTIDRLGNMYITVGNDLQKVDAVTGTISTLATTFYGRKYLMVDRSGTIYYPYNNELIKMDNNGSNMQVVATGVGNPSGAAMDEFGSIYMSYRNTSEIKKFTPAFTSNRVAVSIGIESVAVPTFTAPTYVLGIPATPLTATSGATGLLWYTAAMGGTGVTEITPTTNATGTTSYWVSSTNDNECESERVEMVVTVVTAPGTHLSFDGINDFVSLGTSATLKPTAALTVEFNAYSSDWSGITNPVTLIGNTQAGGYAIGVSGTNLSAVLRRNGTYGTVLKPLSEISSGWHHFAMTYDNQNLRFYMDGVLVGTNDAGSTYPIVYNPNNSTIVGGESSGTAGVAEANRYFNGGIDDLRIWNVVRTEAQISSNNVCELLGTETGLVAYYNFNQGTGGVTNTSINTLTNKVANGTNGSLQNFALTGVTSNWMAGSPTITGVAVPAAPMVVSPVVYVQNATATALTVTSGGTNLLWYTTATAGMGIATAPTPSTATVGSTSYWVSEKNANGCESERTEIVVTINEFTTPGCWKQISYGKEHTIAIAENGTLWGWGKNNLYQLGLGFYVYATQTLPVQIGTANNWQSIATHDNSTMAITTEGTLWAWGQGTLGMGSNSSIGFPTQLGTDSDWKSVSVSAEHCLAIKTTGTLWSWGSGGNGALGLGSELNNTLKSAPTQVGSATHWKAIAASKGFSIALTTSGTLWSWGSSQDGRLGIGNTSSQYVPVQVGTDTDWQSITTGEEYALAIKNTGTLWSWGANSYGQLGLGNTSGTNIPVQVGSATHWQNVSAGLFHTLAITTDGTLWSWGYNNYGELGLGDNVNRNVPVQVGLQNNWQSIDARVFNSAALTDEGTLFTWGYNSNSQLGIGNTTNKNVPTGINCPTCATESVDVPTVVSPLIVMQGATPSSLTATSGDTGLLWYTHPTEGTGSTTAPLTSTTNPNTTSYWVSSTNANGCESNRVVIRVEVQANTNANCWKQIVAGNNHSLAIAQNGTLWAWGNNNLGQLGLGDLTNRTVPTQVGTASNWAFVSAKRLFSMAITTSGTLWAWGYNNDNQLGLNDEINRNIPTQVGTATDWKMVATTEQFCIGIKTNGSLWSWGESVFGALGQGNTYQLAVPTQIGTSTQWKTVSLGSNHAFAITTAGTLWAWGYDNQSYTLGLGINYDYIKTPVQVGTASNWDTVATLSSHTLAITTSGTLWAWGNNSNGQLGNPSVSNVNIPLQVGTETHWSSIATGSNFSIATTTSGTLWAWGDNYFGQLGLGDTNRRIQPTQVGLATHWQSISANEYYAAGLTNTGSLNTWGNNNYGQLGLANTTDQKVPNGLNCPSCVAVTTWDGTAWSNGLPDTTKNTIFEGNYTGVGFDACSIEVSPMANVVINTAENLEILNQVNIATDATFTLENNTNLVQITDKINSGNAVVKRNSTPMIRLDYTAWGSPVTAQKLLAFSPATLANRFYTYDPSATLQANAWIPVTAPSTTDFVTGKGYFIRVPNTWSATDASPYLGKFTGVLNNGTVNIPTTTGYNLVANPYPSAIEAADFITDNASRGVSALYYWTHSSPATNGVYLQNNYASRTALGGTAAAQGGEIPDEYIQVGQGFFANTTSDGNLIFNNTMRTKQSNNQFFKGANTVQDKHRYWLNLNDATTSYNQILVGYINSATNDYDQGIDGSLMTTSTSFIASKINNEKYVIQGRNGNFDSTDEVELAFTANNNGAYTIALDAFDGLFVNQDLFLWDKQLNVKHNLKQAAYTFTTTAGMFDNRFAIVYENTTLDTPVFDTHLLLVYVDAENYIQFVNPNQNISSIQIYDVMGRVLYTETQIQKNKTAVFNAFEHQVLLIKTTLENGFTNTTKISN